MVAMHNIPSMDGAVSCNGNGGIAVDNLILVIDAMNRRSLNVAPTFLPLINIFLTAYFSRRPPGSQASLGAVERSWFD